MEKFTLPREEAIALMKEKEEPYKVELIEDLPEDAEISFYKQGEGFTDLMCRTTSDEYQGNQGIQTDFLFHGILERRFQQSTAYSVSMEQHLITKDELNAYLEHLEDIKKRDHNKLRTRDGIIYYCRCDRAGTSTYYAKRCPSMIQTLQRWIEDLEDNEWGYVRTKTPLMAKVRFV